ncbi:MAG: hypothetical protein NVSMB1_22280 [Polyangiales bacterium]
MSQFVVLSTNDNQICDFQGWLRHAVIFSEAWTGCGFAALGQAKVTLGTAWVIFWLVFAVGCGTSSRGPNAGDAAITDGAPTTFVSDGSDAPEVDARAEPVPPACPVDVAPSPGVVITDRGAVRGASAGLSWVYRGIPYAAPPVGAHRFRPPMPAPCFASVRDATAFGNVCVQPDGSGSEDCLTLNVWTPKDAIGASLRPVMFFIHGGGNIQGSASCWDEPQRIADASGTVMVTANYRVGALGFFTHPALDAESPKGASGNYGILDLIAALQWVHQNIAAFQGDPKRVMIPCSTARAGICPEPCQLPA